MSAGARRRIVFLNRVFYPDELATSRLLTDLACELAADYEILVICSRTTQPPAEPDPRIRVRRVPFGRSGKTPLLRRGLADVFFLASALFLLLLMLRRGDLLVAKTDPPLLSTVATLAGWLRRRPSLIWHQDIYPEIAVRLGVVPDGLAARGLRALRDLSVRQARQNVAIGADMARFLAAHGGAVTTIPNWALNERVADEPEVRAWRAARGLGDDFVIAHSGTLGRVHPPAALEALLAPGAMPAGIRLLLSGGGHHYEQLQRQYAGHPQALFLPYQPEAQLPVLLAAADLQLVLLEPDLSELVFPSKFAGILSAGRPCLFIGAPNCDLARQVEEAGCGAVLAPDRAGELPDLVSRLANEPGRLARMGQAARTLHQQIYARAVCLDAWRALLPEAFG